MEQRRHASGSHSRVVKNPMNRSLPRCLLLIALFIGAQALFLQSSIFRIHSIYVIGNHHVKTRELLEQVQVAQGQPLLRYWPGQLAKQLVSHREIYQATVSYGLPGRVEISLVERTPVLQVSSKSHRPRWFAVDREGIVLHALPQGDERLPRLMVQQSVNLETRLHPKVLHDFAKAVRIIEKDLPQRVWYYSLDQRGSLSLRTFANRRPFDVQIGEPVKVEYKMRLLKSLLDQTPKQLQPINIDLRYSSPIVKFLHPPTPPKPKEEKKA